MRERTEREKRTESERDNTEIEKERNSSEIEREREMGVGEVR